MARAALVLLLLVTEALAHGGAFRPPPRGRPGDPFTPGVPSRGPTTAGAPGGVAMSPWETWWAYNREHYLRVRDRVRERTVISGTPTGREDPFDRTALRETILIPAMLEALGDPDEEVRTAAAVALGKFRAPAAVPKLLEMRAKDNVKQVREAAMLGLLLMRDDGLKEFFRGVANDDREDRRDRGFAVLAAGFLRDVEFLHQILEKGEQTLNGSNTAVDELVACAALGLGLGGEPEQAAVLAVLAVDERRPKQARGYAGGSIGRLGNPTALPELLSLIRDGDAEDLARVGAAIGSGALVVRDDTAIIDLLGSKAQRDKNGGVRTLLAMSLGRIGGDRAGMHLVNGLRSCEEAERGFFLLALGISGADGAGDVLMEQFGRLKNNNDRAACALALGLAGHRAAAQTLRDQLGRGNPMFVGHGMVALGLLDDEQSIPLVQQILATDRNAVIQREGALALALLRRAAAIPDLLRGLEKASSTHARGAAAQALGLVGNESAVEPLLAIYRDRKRQGEERAIALAALGRIGDPERIPLLATLSFDLNPYVIVDAVREAMTIL